MVYGPTSDGTVRMMMDRRSIHCSFTSSTPAFVCKIESPRRWCGSSCRSRCPSPSSSSRSTRYLGNKAIKTQHPIPPSPPPNHSPNPNQATRRQERERVALAAQALHRVFTSPVGLTLLDDPAVLPSLVGGVYVCVCVCLIVLFVWMLCVHVERSRVDGFHTRTFSPTGPPKTPPPPPPNVQTQRAVPPGGGGAEARHARPRPKPPAHRARQRLQRHRTWFNFLLSSEPRQPAPAGPPPHSPPPNHPLPPHPPTQPTATTTGPLALDIPPGREARRGALIRRLVESGAVLEALARGVADPSIAGMCMWFELLAICRGGVCGVGLTSTLILHPPFHP